MFLGFLVLITALSISAVAIYYSVAGLVAIFAAAAIPIMIMGSVLEIGKLVTAVWLHRYWHEATWWIKSYLSVAVVVLMFITSMGIFGFLSRAHIEQTAQATQSVQQIQQIEDQITREQSVIERSNITIDGLQSSGSERDQEIQIQIDREQARIDTAYERIEPALQEQRDIIQQRDLLKQEKISEIQNEINIIQNELENLQTALANNNVRAVQGIVGVRQDGAFGSGTQRAVDDYRRIREERLSQLQQEINDVRNSVDALATSARSEIARLRQFAEQQISDSNQLISRLRQQIGVTDTNQIETDIEEQRQRIAESNKTIDDLIEEKYTLETEYRKLEAEVGPVKYLAEFIYGESADTDLLEEAVRWVIVIIIFVFDPLAVLLLIASQQTFEIHKRKTELYSSKKEENDVDFVRPSGFRNIEELPETRLKDHSDGGNSNSTDVKDPSRDVEPGETGTRPQRGVLSKGMATEEVDAVKVAGEYRSKKKIGTKSTEELSPKIEEENTEKPELTLEEKRALEYKEKERSANFNNDKEAWKYDHPDQTLKMYKTLYINGKIDSLPWEGYRQNSEQNADSLFNKLQQRSDSDNN